MPTYDYHCTACGHRFEIIHGLHAAGPSECPRCGSGPVRKRIVAPTIHFKGTGWAKKERAKAAGGSKSSTRAEGEKDKTGSTEEPKAKPSPGEPASPSASGGPD